MYAIKSFKPGNLFSIDKSLLTTIAANYFGKLSVLKVAQRSMAPYRVTVGHKLKITINQD